jgi:hypothetical protein
LRSIFVQSTYLCMRKKIILLLSIKIREFDFFRYDLYEYEKELGYDVEAHELIDYVNPGFSKIFSKKFESTKIKKFSNFYSWKKEMLAQKKINQDNLFVINEIQSVDFRSLKVNYFLKKNKIKTLSYSLINHPEYENLNFSKKIFWFVKNLLTNNKKLLIFFESKISFFLSYLFGLYPNFILTFNRDEKKIRKNLLLIKGNSRDYNMFLKCKTSNVKLTKPFGLFLDSPTPVHNLGDSFIIGNKKNIRGTKENWLTSVNNFLEFIEKKLNLNMLIVPHPKIEYSEENLKIYNGRKLLKERLAAVSNNAKLIISRDSAGAAFAAINKIPSIFIYTNELVSLKSNFLIHQKKFAKEFGLQPINIDKKLTDNELEKILLFDTAKYNEYVKKYCTAREDNKINYQIISEIFNKT